MKKRIILVFTSLFVFTTTINQSLVMANDEISDENEIMEIDEIKAIDENTQDYKSVNTEKDNSIDIDEKASIIDNKTNNTGIIGGVKWTIYNDTKLVIEPLSGAAGKIEKANDLSVLKDFNGDIVIKEGVIFPSDSRNLFNKFAARSLELNNDTSNVTNMSIMFNDVSNVKSLDLSKFNTSNVTNMTSMFSGMKSLESINLSSFDTSKVKTMNSMFFATTNLKNIDLSNFNTSSVTSMNAMFSRSSSLVNLDISSFDTSEVLNIGNMFSNMTSLKTLNISSFRTDKLKIMSDTFFNTKSLLSIDLSNFDTSKVKHMQNLFNGASSITKLDLSNFDTENVELMDSIFKNLDSLVSISLGEKSIFNKANASFIDYKSPYNGKWFYEKDKEINYKDINDLMNNYNGSKTGTYYMGKSFMLDFYIDGKKESYLVEDSNKIEAALIPNTSKEGYKFLEWNTKEDGSGISFNPYTDVITEDISVYAIYQANNYKVTFNYDSKMKDIYVEHNEMIDQEKLPNSDKVGHRFIEWNTKEDGSGETFDPSIEFIIADLNVYAIYDVNTYSISFIYDAEEKSLDVQYNSQIDSKDLPDASKEGYKFLEWNTKEDGSGIVFNPDDNLITEDMTVYAIYEINTYVVSFNYAQEIKDVYVEYKDVVEESDLPDTYKEGYIFIEWNTKEDGSGISVDPIEEVVIEDADYYAIYKVKDLNVKKPSEKTKTMETSNLPKTGIKEDISSMISLLLACLLILLISKKKKNKYN